MNPLIILAAPFCGAFISFFIGQKKESLRDLFDILLTAGILIGVLTLGQDLSSGPIVRHMPHLMGTGLDISIGPLQYLMLLLTSGIWFLTTLFLIQYVPTRKKRNRFHFFFLLTFASTLGFFMTNNILNQFTFFEILSLSGYFLIIHDEDNEAHGAGALYLTLAIMGGLAALLGILIAYEATGTLIISEISRLLPLMETERRIAGGLLFFGYAIKAGIFPLHVWLPKAYAAAPIPATAVLTGILAKTGLYGLFVTSVQITGGDPVFGWLALCLGFITLFHGGILALMQHNVKLILAYSSMSQYGLILTGIGVGALAGPEGALALTGAFSQMVSHSLFKVLLFLSIGLLYLKTQELDLNLIHGIGRRSPLLMLTVPIGIFSAWGLPGFSGAVSKALLHEGLSHWSHSLPPGSSQLLEGLFVLGSALTVAYLLKLLGAFFLDSPSEFSAMIWLKRRKRAAVPMGVLSMLILFIGIRPDSLIALTESGFLSGESLHLQGHGMVEALKSAAPPLLLGLGIHLFSTRRFLRSVSDEGIRYLNPASGWFNLEANLYTPMTQGILFRSTKLISLIDSALIQTVRQSTRLLKAADALLQPVELTESSPEPPLDLVKGIPETVVEPSTEWPPFRKTIPDTTPSIAKKPQLPWFSIKLPDSSGQLMRSLIEKSSGLTFALYLFGAFLVALLFVLVLR